MKAQEAKKQIIETIIKMSGEVSPYDVFFDWVHLMALQLSLLPVCLRGSWSKAEKEVFEARNTERLKVLEKYDAEGRQKLEMMTELLGDAMGDEPTDCLGEIYMEAGLGNKHTGQFFTPFNLSLMMARLNLADVKEGQKVNLTEPSCGAGGMIIASAQILKDRGINYQQVLDVVAQDLDWKSVYMCYTQCSLLGIKAIVVQGDTLQQPFKPGDALRKENIFLTPAKEGVADFIQLVGDLTEKREAAYNDQ